MQSVNDFIKNYQVTDKHQIDFMWNGKHGDELEDANYEFREAVAKSLVIGDIKGSDELVRDVFLVEAAFSAAIWGATMNLHELGTLLLSQARSKHIDAFFEGKGQSFDTDCDVNACNVPSSILQDIVNELSTNPKCKNAKKEDIDYYIGYLTDYISVTP